MILSAPLEQHRTCVTGAFCVIGSLGVLCMGNRASMVLDTCNSWKEEVNITVVEGFRNTEMASMVEGYGTAVLRYGPSVVDGGTYRLCWCYVAECLEPKDFGTDFRTLTPIGPERQEGKTGMSGQQCHFQGLIGQHLSADNKLLRPPLPL